MMLQTILAAVVLSFCAPAAAAVYEIDPAHSQVSFKVRHLVGKVHGRFTKFSGTIAYEPGKPEGWRASAEIDPASINTDSEKRDEHLRGADFFDTAKCPAMAFKSLRATDVKDGAAKLHGELTLHCVTRPVVLELELAGSAADPWGGRRAGFSARTKLDRKDYGIVWNKLMDNGGAIIGDDVEVSIEIEAVEKVK